MTAFDATLNVSDIRVFPDLPPDAEPDEKTETATMFLGVTALAPVGPQQLLQVPIGGFRVPLAKDSVDNLIQELMKVSERMKDVIDIPIAKSLAGVEEAAKQEARLRNG